MNENTFHEINYSEIPPEVLKLSRKIENHIIDPALYVKHSVNRGLRDPKGKGVLTGLTEISDIISGKIIDGEKFSCEGELYYRGYLIDDIVSDLTQSNRFGFEESTYLLLFGELPDKTQLSQFNSLIAKYRTLPPSFVRDIIMKAPSRNMMNTLARSVLTLYSYDDSAEDTSIPNVLHQCLQLFALLPVLSVYGYQAFSHYYDNNSLFIHNPISSLSTAENILHLLRPDSQYTKLEAQILDIALILHADHGGGNNSTFTTHVVSSSGTDTYSTIAASLGSLKGPKHGGANIKVVEMFEDMKKTIKHWDSKEEITQYLLGLLRKERFDKTGLIYGMGHAVYSLSDPRANILKRFVETLSQEKNLEEEYKLYTLVEELAPQIITNERKIYKGVSANIDFYSGFVYSMLNLPKELFTPIFAIARMAGWSAHRLEELNNSGKIIRPAYLSVCDHRPYTNLNNR